MRHLGVESPIRATQKQPMKWWWIMNTTVENKQLRFTKHLFSCGILLMICEVSFTVAYLLRHLLAKDLAIGITLTLVAIILVKMLDVEDRLFQ